MTIVNLTPHILTIYNEAQELVVTVPPSGTVARVSSEREVIGNVDGVTLYRTKYGNVVDGPPPPQEGTIYVVSLMVRQALSHPDLYSPGELIRDKTGQPVGCIGLSQ